MTSFDNLEIDEIIERLDTDPAFGLHFVVDNQPDLIVSELKAHGAENVDTADQAYNNLVYLYNNDKPKLMEVLEAIPYDNSASNYTGHIKEQAAEDGVMQTRSFGSILTIVGAVAGSLGTIFTGGGSESEAERLERERREREERERKARTNMLLVGGLIVAVLVVVVVVSMKNKGK